jgi:hypothetical protein
VPRIVVLAFHINKLSLILTTLGEEETAARNGDLTGGRGDARI